jgi:hypothetical protein
MGHFTSPIFIRAYPRIAFGCVLSATNRPGLSDTEFSGSRCESVVENLLTTQSQRKNRLRRPRNFGVDFPRDGDQDGVRSSAVSRPWVANHGTSGRARRTLRKRPARMVGLFAFARQPDRNAGAHGSFGMQAGKQWNRCPICWPVPAGDTSCYSTVRLKA